MVRKYLPTADHEVGNREGERREMQDVEGVVLLRGARNLAQSLPPERWTIATSCTRPLAEVRLRAAGLPVPQGARHFHRRNPGQTTSGTISQSRGEAWFPSLGARDFRRRSGRHPRRQAAGARVIAFRTAVQETELRGAGADWTLDDCAPM
jgi:sugar-phosphatase